MTEPSWVPIAYRDFYDFPRMVATTVGTTTYVFDCPFDENLDDYAPYFDVYVLPEEQGGLLEQDSWVDLPSIGERIGRVSVAAARFDETRRQAIDASFLKHVEP